jgi:hypothetical protein
VDAGANEISTDAKYLMTSQVSVQAVVYDKTDDEGNVLEPAYMASRTAVWNVDEKGETKTEYVDEKAAAPVMDDYTFDVAENETGTAYNFGYKSDESRRLVAQILVTDETGNLLEYTYASGAFTMKKESFSYVQDDVTVVNKVQIRFAGITDSGISTWSVWYALAENGTLTEVKEFEVQADELSAEMLFEMWNNQSGDTEEKTAGEAQGSITEIPADELATENATENTTTENVTTESTATESQSTESTTAEATESTTTESTTAENTSTESTTTESSVTESTEGITSEADKVEDAGSDDTSVK